MNDHVTVVEPVYGVPLIGCDDRYEDRATAGRHLATFLGRFRGGHAIVLALPPGGVAVAGELARSLRLQLDVLVVREFRVRANPVIVAGAVGEAGGLCLNGAAIRYSGITPHALWEAALHEQALIAHLVRRYRRERPLPLSNRRPVILVDDGMHSGLAQLAALQALRHYHPPACIIATPRAHPTALRRITPWADQVVALDDHASTRADDIDGWQTSLGDDDATILLDRYRLHTEI
ncbi:MAG: phosphoribosyltransferase [Chloroflexi bacterium]|nr:phosphoribosyltransferase [Chloroflexota bacterium]